MHKNNTPTKESRPCEYCSLGCTTQIYVSICTYTKPMVPTGSDEPKLRTFQGPSQNQISGYKDFHGEFHNADIEKSIPYMW